jgi:hypothetical protein
MAQKTGPIGPRQDEMPAKCGEKWGRMGRRRGPILLQMGQNRPRNRPTRKG